MIINASGREEMSGGLTLLWTNENPTSEFKADTTIELDLSNYSMLYVVALASDKYQYLTTSPIIVDFTIVGQCVRCRAGMTVGSRTVTLSNTGVAFSTATYETCSTTGTLTVGTGTKYVIPYKIYGGM